MTLKPIFEHGKDVIYSLIEYAQRPSTSKRNWKAWNTFFILMLVVLLLITLWLDRTPSEFNPLQKAQDVATLNQQKMVTGYTSTVTLIALVDALLEKPGGYLSNDVLPPSIWMDNVPNWEFGVLVQVRDFSRALRNDISRSQSQSLEDPDLSIAEPQFNFNSESWLFPPTEREYRKGADALHAYLNRLSNTQENDAQFYARADNLADWLAIVEKRLGSLSQRLSASVGQIRINTDLAGESSAQQSTPAPAELITQTPWTHIDDVFYESRGSAWALIHLLKAIEHDFSDILVKKNALISVRQIVRELEATQEVIWSPMIMNGSGFGLFANHSLVMASYISRANAAIIDLRTLLNQG